MSTPHSSISTSPLERSYSAREVGIDREFLSSRLDAWQSNLVGTDKLPYSRILIQRRGKIVYARGAGPADCDLHRMFGMSQPLTAVGVLFLYERGFLALDDYLDKFLPGFAKLQVLEVKDGELKRIRGRITIRELLTHTSGMSFGYDASGDLIAVDPVYVGNGIREGIPLERISSKLAKAPLAFNPGEFWHYSLGYEVLGHVVEVVSGMKFAQFMKQNVFDPLNMKDTMFSIAPEQEHRLGKLYMPSSSKKSMLYPKHKRSQHLSGLVDISKDSDKRVDDLLNNDKIGGTGVVSTIEDYHRFLACLQNNGVSKETGARVLGPRTIELMRTNHIGPNRDLLSMAKLKIAEIPLKGVGFGLGVSVHLRNDMHGEPMSPGTYGWGGSASTYFFVDPVEELHVIFFTQVMYLPKADLDLRLQLAQIVYSALTETKNSRL